LTAVVREFNRITVRKLADVDKVRGRSKFDKLLTAYLDAWKESEDATESIELSRSTRRANPGGPFATPNRNALPATASREPRQSAYTASRRSAPHGTLAPTDSAAGRSDAPGAYGGEMPKSRISEQMPREYIHSCAPEQ